MEEKRINLWNEAGKAGLVLGLVSIAYLIITHFTGKMAGSGLGAFAIGTLNFVLWAGKLFLCIWLVRYFLLQFSKRNPSADNKKVFSFGMVTALYSAILYSAFYLLYVLYLAPESIAASMDAIMSQYASGVDSNTLEMMENMKADMPTISFFVNLVWCWLFGTILSAIFSRKIPANADDPFKTTE